MAAAASRRERRRSSCVRRDPDDILRSLRAVKGELGRTLSLSGSTARRKYHTYYRLIRITQPLYHIHLNILVNINAII